MVAAAHDRHRPGADNFAHHLLGGDHGVSIPVLRAFEGRGPITLIQIDQHLDWRDEVNGIKDGLSSPMRRASEMEHIEQIFQIGLSATGSARQEEVDAAKAWGAHLIPAHELHEVGMDAVLRLIPDGGRYYLTVDMDGMDCAIAPAVAAPMPGGVSFVEARRLVHGLVAKGRVVGMDVVEITPRTDINRITCITAGRLIVNLIGAAVRAGYFDEAARAQTKAQYRTQGATQARHRPQGAAPMPCAACRCLGDARADANLCLAMAGRPVRRAHLTHGRFLPIADIADTAVAATREHAALAVHAAPRLQCKPDTRNRSCLQGRHG